MKRIIMVIVLGLFFSCSTKHFTGKDYTFYDENFRLQPDAVLKTNGVYVLESIWTDENGGTAKKPDVHTFYRFYTTGQCNMILDTDNKITTPQQYSAVVNAAAHKGETLFESYYRLKEDKIVIQGLMAKPVKQFEYKYGYVKNNELIIVKSTIEGKGEFKDKYFTDYYREHYKFMALDDLNNNPDW